MKLLLVIIALSAFAETGYGCLAQESEGSSLSALFIAGGNSVAASSIEGQLTGGLRDAILNETGHFIGNIVENLAKEVSIQSHLQITVLKLAKENFDSNVAELPPIDAAKNSLDIALKFLNEKVQEAFNIIPKTLGGNAVVKTKKSKKKKDSSDSGKSSSSEKKPAVHNLFDLTNNLAQLLDADISAVYKFQKKVLSAGYEEVTGAYTDVQEKFRNVIINEHLFPALQSIVLGVQEKREITETHVNVVTWNKFLALNDQLAIVAANIGAVEESTTLNLNGGEIPTTIFTEEEN